jgi:hypothetical protein
VLLAAEGRLLCGRYGPRYLLDGIARHLERMAPERRDEYLAAIRTRADELVAADRDMVVDGPAEGALRLSAVVLAAFEVLRPHFDGDERRTVAYLQHVLTGMLQRPLDLGVGLLTRGADPLDALDKACRTDVAMYGRYFDIGFDRPDDDVFEMRVGRCLFHDFFVRHGAAPVTTVLCAWDKTWMADIDPAVSGLRAERTSLMSMGDDSCLFRVLRTDDPLAAPIDALEEAGPAQ